jgi:hypothetical protein
MGDETTATNHIFCPSALRFYCNRRPGCFTRQPRIPEQIHFSLSGRRQKQLLPGMPKQEKFDLDKLMLLKVLPNGS